jgi:cytochrome c
MRRPDTPSPLTPAAVRVFASSDPQRPNGRAARLHAAALILLLVWLAVCTPGTATAQSVERGQAVYQAHCAGCHSPDVHGDGPAHRGVVGRRAGALADFDYSPALRSSKILWTRATLKAWLTNPEALIPGQGMDYMLEDEREREDVVAYLATLKRMR